MRGSTYDLKNMTVFSQGKTFQLKKSKNNARNRPDNNSKGGTAGLLGSDSQDYKRMGKAFEDTRGGPYNCTVSVSDMMEGLMDHYIN